MTGHRGGRERPEEKRAAQIVEATTMCRVERIPEDGSQHPDYALLNASGNQVGVLEVTMVSDRATNAFWSRANREYRSFRDERLRRGWIVWLAGPTRAPRPLRSPVADLLVQLESENVGHGSALPQRYLFPVRELPADLADLGVVEVEAVGPDSREEGFVAFNVMPRGGPYGLPSILGPLEGVLWKTDNRDKLRGSLPRRELFVWVEPPSVAASVLGTYSDPPWLEKVATLAPPKMPEEATHVWAGLWSDGQHVLANALWQADRNGWTVMTPPAVGCPAS